ncbi:MAG TPA: methyltransferase, partial [Xanthobacteraceae bacterium]|nr:methyltransferase [Xanthobacteraceae bacterium]
VANDIDPFAIPAIALNAAANNVTLETETMDRLDPATPSEPFGTVLAGDIFYERDTAARAFVFLQRMKTQGALTLVGDPGRSYLPKEQMTVLAEYEVPVIRDLEDAEIKRTKVWALKD